MPTGSSLTEQAVRPAAPTVKSSVEVVPPTIQVGVVDTATNVEPVLSAEETAIVSGQIEKPISSTSALDHAALDEISATAGQGEIGTAAISLVESLPDTAILPERNERPDLIAHETEYLADNRFDQATKRGFRELDIRYTDTRTGAKYIMDQLDVYGAHLGVLPVPEDMSQVPEGAAAQAAYINTLAEKQIQQAFSITEFAKEGQAATPEQQKAESVRQMTKQYVDLALQARTAGEMAQLSEVDFTRQLSRLVRENILKLSYQDYIAAENTLGDHGVRHLVDHNIAVTQRLADQLETNGQIVSPADRLMMYQIMIDHDMGYAMEPVRQLINQGQMWADRGHNVLAAKFLRERATTNGDPLGQLFTPDQLAIMHEGILTHDSSRIDFQIGSETPEAKRENIMSAIHLADNTHAFETKLPEVLFGNPESLRTLLLMKIAAESGLGEETLAGLKADLKRQMQEHEGWSDRYKASLAQAVEGLSADSYRFTVPRICGNNPEFTMDSNGHVTVTVEESFAHREVMGLFGQEELRQFRKFIGDLGAGEIDPNAEQIEGKNVMVALRKPEDREAVQETAYQREVLQVLTTEPLRTLVDVYEGIVLERQRIQTDASIDDTTRDDQLRETNDRAQMLFSAYQRFEEKLRAQPVQQGGET